MNDIELIQQIKEGNKNAFKELIEQYQDRLFIISIGFLHNKEDAEEIVQDVFIEVYHSIHKFRQESKLLTWLYRITVNKSLNLLRKNKQNSIIKSIDSFFSNAEKKEFDLADHNQMNANEILEHKEDAEILYKAINSLTKNQRIAFTLNKYDDLTYKDIAQVMDLTLSSVESLIYRAKINLQKNLTIKQ